MNSHSFNLIATCAFGLELPVKWELSKLGYDGKVISPGKVGFAGDWKAVARTNLWLRVADRVQIEIARFQAADFDALFDTTRDMDWSQWLGADAKFPVSGRSRHSQLTSVPAVQRSVKRAIVMSLQREYKTETLPETGPEYRIEIALLNDEATLTLDTTGPSLHKRGYRRLIGDAPIKETLAAAMISLSVWNPDRPLIDPFCGSGTIPIEAAMIGLNIAPGLKRDFLAAEWPQMDQVFWKQAREEALDLQQLDRQMQIMGTDVDTEVLSLARKHAELADVTEHVHFQQRSFDGLRSKREYGCVITNPPYGKRLEEEKGLKPLYKSIPAVLQRLPTWSHFIITSMPHFEKIIQKSATRRRKLYNGRIECMYYQYLGPRPPRKNDEIQNGAVSSVPVVDSKDPVSSEQETKQPEKKIVADTAVFGGLGDKDRSQAELFATRLQKRARHLRKWPKKGITCFRLYERDIPELPFVVDRYEDCFHITEYDRPHDRHLDHHASWLELMKKTVAKTFEVPIQRVFMKTRGRQAGKTQHEKIKSDQRRITVSEGDLKFLVNLSDYVDTGLFLDHRITRQMVRDEAKGKRFLNLFAYTGSFSVYAAAGGAASTCTVDWSNTYLDWARDNMHLNGYEDPKHIFVNRDAATFAADLSANEFDLVVVDPPTFSNSKRTEEVWDVQRDHAKILNQVRDSLSPNGLIYFSTNFRKFKLAEEELAGFKIIEISKQTVPDDFRNQRIHRCWKLFKK